MKHFFSLILICLLLLNEAYTVIVYVNFKFREDFVLKNLCEMKDQAENTCLGSCQIKRKLDFGDSEQKSKKQKIPPPPVKRFSFYRCALSEIILPDLTLAANLTQHINITEDWSGDEYVNSIFHPPKS